MNKATIKNADVRGKRVLTRVDFNVPLDKGRVADDTRIVAALPTINYIVDHGGTVVLMSHLGRPKGKVNEEMRLGPAAARLEELLGREVVALDDCVGPMVEEKVRALAPGSVALLENLRFHPEEEKNDPEFARKLAALGDLYCNDAFGSAHRAHASTAGVCHFLPSYAGFLMEKEINFLGRLLADPARPFVAILGGAKVADKIAVLRNLLDRVDRFIIGGGMAFTFLHLEGKKIGRSLLDPEPEHARAFLEEARRRGKSVILPVDVVIAPGLGDGVPTSTVSVDAIPDDQMGLDIGPQTVKRFADALADARTILWNGPMGVFENPLFAEGTKQLAEVVAGSEAMTVLGGGDTASAAEQMGVAGKMTHISTGGGASLEFLEGRELPGVALLREGAEASR
jgi:phosphoglycerate kinase